MKLKKLAALVVAGALCVSAFTGCGVDAKEPVATLGEQTVTFDMANFLCKYQKATVDDVYMMYFGQPAWKYDLTGSGTTLEEQLKDSAMDVLHDLYTLKANMAEYKVEITKEDEEAIAKVVKAFMEGNTEEALKELGATEEIVTEMLTLYTIQAKMFDAITADVDRVVSDEDANMRGYSIVTISLQGEYNSKGTYVKYTEAQIKEIKEKAAKMEETLKTNKDLKKVAKEYGFTVSEKAYAKDDSSLDADVLKALNALKEGEVSGQVTTKSAIYFVKIDAETDKEATEENRESIIAERENKQYDKVMKKLQKNDGWTVEEKLLEKIDFHNLFTQQTGSESSEHDHDHEHTESTEKGSEVKGTESTEKK